MKAIYAVLFFYLFSLPLLFSQQTGKVEYPSLGISFVIPEGWVGQERNGTFFMGSNTIPGIIIMSTSEAKTLEVLKQEAKAGLIEGNGTNLQMSTTQFDNIGNNGIGTTFEGILEHQPAKAYMAGLINPHGNGVAIISTTLKDQYSVVHKEAALKIAKSVEFRKVDAGRLAAQWKERIRGTRLTYMSSYSSGYGSGGYSDKTVIDLCSQGYFNFSSNNHMSIDVGSTAYSNSSGSGSGKWKIIGQQGQAILQLAFHSGEVYEYTLSMDGEKPLLNGKRYFRTWTGENAPDCF